MMEQLPLKEQAYQSIKTKLLHCEYFPGSSLNEKELLESLNMGRTPMREALLQLQNEGYITIIPRKNIMVNPITFQTIQNLYHLRRIIEPQIALEFKASFNTQVLMDLLAQFKNHQEDPVQFYTLDLQFHMHLVNCSNNTLLIQYYQQLMDLQFQIGMYTYFIGKSNHFEQTLTEHQTIIESLLTQNDESIKQTVLYHINQSMLASIHALESK